MQKRNSKPSINTYAAKLFFQWRHIKNGQSDKRRLSQHVVFHIKARTAHKALRKAKSLGRQQQYKYKTVDRAKGLYEFIGVEELKIIGVQCEENEVWYEIQELMRPMERRNRYIPPENMLEAIRNND